MPHFLIKKEQINNNEITLFEDDNFFHLTKSLRINIGQKVKFIDENEIVYLTTVLNIDKKSLTAKIIDSYQTERTLKYDICLIQSVLMNDGQNLLIANATQTGTKEIFPVISENCAVSSSSLKNKKEKWGKIAYENFKQCERGDMPKINDISNLKETLSKFKKENIIIYAEKNSNISLKESLTNLDKNEKIAVVIGPEGGFSNEEFEYFKNENFKLVSLGNMIYKAPNAVVAGLYGVISLLENE